MSLKRDKLVERKKRREPTTGEKKPVASTDEKEDALLISERIRGYRSMFSHIHQFWKEGGGHAQLEGKGEKRKSSRGRWLLT